MARITDYDGLKSEAARILTKPETLYDPDVCIQMTEGPIKRIVRNLEAETTATASLATPTIAWPTDFGGVRQMRITSTTPNFPVLPVSPIQLYGYDNSTTGRPVYFAQVSEKFEFWPPPDATYTLEISYFKGLPALTSENSTNWFLTRYPDVYLYGLLWHACETLQDWDRAARFKAEFGAGLEEVQNDDQQTRWSGTPLVMRVDHANP